MITKESYRPKFMVKRRKIKSPSVRTRLINRNKYKKNRSKIKKYNKQYRKRFRRQLGIRRRLRKRRI